MIASRGIADESAVDGCGSREHFAGRQVGPVARADEAAGFHPVEAAIEMGGERRAASVLTVSVSRAEHALAELVAQAVDQAVVGAHALLHDFGSDADHVGVADLTALDDPDDGHARAEFAGLRRHAHSANVGGLESLQNISAGAPVMGRGPKSSRRRPVYFA